MVTAFASVVLAALAAFSLTNDNVAISFDASGEVSSLTELPGGRPRRGRAHGGTGKIAIIISNNL